MRAFLQQEDDAIRAINSWTTGSLVHQAIKALSADTENWSIRVATVLFANHQLGTLYLEIPPLGNDPLTDWLDQQGQHEISETISNWPLPVRLLAARFLLKEVHPRERLEMVDYFFDEVARLLPDVKNSIEQYGPGSRNPFSQIPPRDSGTLFADEQAFVEAHEFPEVVVISTGRGAQVFHRDLHCKGLTQVDFLRNAIVSVPKERAIRPGVGSSPRRPCEICFPWFANPDSQAYKRYMDGQ